VCVSVSLRIHQRKTDGDGTQPVSDFFQVELKTLATFITTLHDAEEHLAGLSKLMGGGDDNLGNDKLNEAGAGFQKSWAYGAGQLATAVTETTGAVGDVTKAYQGADQAVHNAVHTIGTALDMIGNEAGRLAHSGALGGPMMSSKGPSS
jgi:hypothetical protein